MDSPDVAFLEEKKVQSIEEQLEEVLKICKSANLSKEEVKDMVDILWMDL